MGQLVSRWQFARCTCQPDLGSLGQEPQHLVGPDAISTVRRERETLCDDQAIFDVPVTGRIPVIEYLDGLTIAALRAARVI